jgi:hypothetical protein
LTGLVNATFQGGGGSDTLVGDDKSNDWDITGVDSGLLNGQIFTSIENLIGGAVADSFVLAAGAMMTGLVDGRAGNDILKGGNGSNSWVVNALNAGMVNGRSFEGIEKIEGGSQDDTFVFAGGSVDSVAGGAGSDTLDFSADTAGVVIDLTSGTAKYAGAIADIENVVTGTGDDIIIGTLAATILDTGAGIDTLDFSNVASDLTLTVHADGTVSVTDGTNTVANIAGAENIVTSSGLNTMVFEDGASIEGTISGAGSVVLDYSAYTTIIEVDLAAGSATGTGGVANVAEVIGGAENDTLGGPAEDSTWIIDGPNAGNVGGPSFSGIENLEGAADNEDTFVFEDGGSLSGLIEGGDAGFDTLVVNFTGINDLIYDATGPNSGAVTADGNVIAFEGLEPVTVAGPAATLTVTASTGNDDLVLQRDPIDDTMLALFSSGSIETPKFAPPATSLTIKLNSGDDTLTIVFGFEHHGV